MTLPYTTGLARRPVHYVAMSHLPRDAHLWRAGHPFRPVWKGQRPVNTDRKGQ